MIAIPATLLQMLKGQELLAKVKELGDAPKDKVCEACGYISKAGKPSYTAFYEALMEAKGVVLAPPTTARKPKKGKPLAWNVAVSKTGVIPVSAGYSALLGLEPGDRVDIKHDGDRLILVKAAAAPVVVTPAPTAVTATIEDDDEIVITAPVAAAAERELAPF
ncbi:MAG: hypothetical protein RLZZ124_1096 [Cyanobacteriota bacterium]|jgi:bifunctional DNA-binding transcriptional regulator/antitoxin component of YhaV-PrlF toxin-antitoxin module